MDRLLGAAGIESVDYEDKYMCCGRPSMDEATSAAIARHKLDCIRAAGCNVIAVACPFCFEQFDLGQVVLARKTGQTYDVPVVYVTQLLGLAMGMSPEDMGLSLHKIDCKGVYEDR